MSKSLEPQSHGLYLMSAMVGVTIAIGILNYLEIKSLRDLNEEVVTGFLDEDRSPDSDSSVGKPRVWIEGKRVSV